MFAKAATAEIVAAQRIAITEAGTLFDPAF